MNASSKSRTTREVGSMMGIGIQLVVTVLGFGALGWWLDSKFDTEPWLLLVGVIFGITGGLISFIRTALHAGSSFRGKSSGDTDSNAAPREE